jgi:hypothetical protein
MVDTPQMGSRPNQGVWTMCMTIGTLYWLPMVLSITIGKTNSQVLTRCLTCQAQMR